MMLVLGIPALAGAQASITVWHAYSQGGSEERALREVARAFERERGVRVIVVAQPFGAYASKLESAIPTGNGPDLFLDAHERLASYVERELVVAIDVDAQGRLPALYLDALRTGGALYGVPIALKCAALYVNEALVPRPIEFLEELEALPREPGRYALATEAESAYWNAGLIDAYGASLIDAEGRWGLSAGAARALEHMRRMVRSGAVPEETSGDLVKQLFSSGRAAAAISGPWLAADLPSSLRWRAQPLPRVRATGRPMRPLVTIESAFVAGHARQPELARDFAVYLAIGSGALVRARTGRQVVTDAEAWRDPELARDPFLGAFRRAAEGAVVMPTHPHMRIAFGPADQAIRKVMRGLATPAAALEEGRHRFDDVVRPPPPRADPTWGSLVLGLLLLGATILGIARLRSAETRAAIRASVPAYKYVAHAVVAVGLLVILPLVVGAGTSFFAREGSSFYYVGGANYVEILTARGGELLGHGSFWLVLLVTVLWTVLNVVLHVTIGVALALLLHRPYLRLKGVYRVLLILPWAVPNYVTALAWRGLFHRQLGAVNAILTSLGAEPVSWFSHWATAFSANVATNTWLGFPFMMVVTLGALTAIPRDLYEAAAVDGATAWQRFRLITLPLLRPFLMPAVAMGSVWTFNMFNVVFLVSAGEPDGSTEILVSEAYRWAFTRGNQYGYAAAYAVLIFLILFFGTRVLSPRRASA